MSEGARRKGSGWKIAAAAATLFMAAATGPAHAQGCDHNPAQLDTRTVIQLPQRADPERPVILKSDVPSQPERGKCGTWQRAEAKLFVKLRGGSDQRLDKFVPLQDGRRLLGTAEIAQHAEPLEVVVYFDARGRQPVSDPIEMVGNTRNAHVVPLNHIRFFQLTGGPQLAEPHIELMSVASERPQHRLLIVVCPSICSRGELDEIRELESKLLLRRISEDARGRAAERRPEPPAGALATHPPARPLTPQEKRAEEQRKQQEAREARAREEQERERERRAGRPAEPGAPPLRPGEVPRAIAGPGAISSAPPTGPPPATPPPGARTATDTTVPPPRNLQPPPTLPVSNRIVLRFYDPATGAARDGVIAKAVRGDCGNRDAVAAASQVGGQGGIVNVHGAPGEPVCIIVKPAAGDERCIRLPVGLGAVTGQQRPPARNPPAQQPPPADVWLQYDPQSLPACPGTKPWAVRFMERVANVERALDPLLVADLIAPGTRIADVPLVRDNDGRFAASLRTEQLAALRAEDGINRVALEARFFTRQSVHVDYANYEVRVVVIPEVVSIGNLQFEFWTGEGQQREANQLCELRLDVPQEAKAGEAWAHVDRQPLVLAHEGGAKYRLRINGDPEGKILARLYVTRKAGSDPDLRIALKPLGQTRAGQASPCFLASDSLTADDLARQLVARQTGQPQPALIGIVTADHEAVTGTGLRPDDYEKSFDLAFNLLRDISAITGATSRKPFAFNAVAAAQGGGEIRLHESARNEIGESLHAKLVQTLRNSANGHERLLGTEAMGNVVVAALKRQGVSNAEAPAGIVLLGGSLAPGPRASRLCNSQLTSLIAQQWKDWLPRPHRQLLVISVTGRQVASELVQQGLFKEVAEARSNYIARCAHAIEGQFEHYVLILPEANRLQEQGAISAYLRERARSLFKMQ